MTGIVDYNAGNIKSVERALAYLKAPYVLSKNPKDLENVDRIIFPGVGEAAYAMQQLRETGFDSFLKDWAKSKKKLLGICLGAQIIFDESEESNTKCLGLVPGVIRHFENLWKERGLNEAECRESALLHNALKVPHMGWNDVTFCNGGTKLVEGVADKTDFYFVHSYVIQPDSPEVIKGYAHYGTMVPAIVEQDNISACQFHPEKSGKPGLAILRNYVLSDLAADSTGGAQC
ncbi:MAG: imidazole glycerol phosphate synthase subunit HisH [Treponema sp.]|nr:imidazole glycerol phosphate synthase subunit HisH [Treponema sp.]